MTHEHSYHYCIVIIPVIYQNHYAMMVLKKHIDFLIRLYKAYHEERSIPFCEEWKVYCPRDIPQQNVFYKCGVYICMYAEVLITQSLEVVKYDGQLKTYRELIKNKILK